MLFGRTGSAQARAAVADASPVPFWLDDPQRPDPLPVLVGDHEADLVIVGGGFTGLWAATLAITESPERRVLLIDADRIAGEATGRNGGFVSASLTHGLLNGHARWPEDMPALIELGSRNLDSIEKLVRDEGIDCGFVRDGELTVATEAYQLQGRQAYAELASRLGEDVEVLDAQQTRSIVDSPTFLGSIRGRTSTAVVNPARLAWGLAAACRGRGVRMAERTRVTSMKRRGSAVELTTEHARIRAPRVLLATGAGPSPVREVRRRIAPVYDYVLMTEPLTAEQRDAIGWNDFVGLSDMGNQFHYYRRTHDNRILWGGFDAVYHRGNGFGPQFDQDPESFARLAEHFLVTFPQLRGLRFTHAWGGAIDTCSRFTPFWGRALDGRVAYVAGYTGLGVGASRFGAQVALDLIDGADTAVTRLAMVRSKPMAFPPEPVRSIGINLMRRSLAAADEHEGRRDLWLRTMDRIGLGFDS